MTNSYDNNDQVTPQNAPTENAEGNQVWNPSVGQYHEPAKVKRESYGGVIGAIQDMLVFQGCPIRAYPENFAGIIAALQDLMECLGKIGGLDCCPGVGPTPPGSEIIIDINGKPIIIYPGYPDGEPPLGNLWYDTRQGRLFVYAEDEDTGSHEWYQTNGADGLVHVQEIPDQPVLGDSYIDLTTQVLYVWNGQEWVGVNGWDTRGQTTRNLPLIKAVEGPKGNQRLTPGEIEEILESLPNYDPALPGMIGHLPDPRLFNFDVQEDANEWFTLALFLLDFYNGAVQIGNYPPAPGPTRPGTLFFDEATLEMSILYEDGDSKQWVPISAAFEENTTRVAAVETRVEEVATRVENGLQSVMSSLSSATRDIPSISDRVEQFGQAIGSLGNNIGTVQVALDAFKADVAADVSGIDADILAERTSRESVVTEIQSAIDALKAQVEQQAQEVNLNALADRVDLAIEDIDALGEGKAEASALAELKAAYEATIDNYLPRGGGVLDGQFVMQKSDISLPSIDFSGQVHNGIDAIRWSTQNISGKTDLNLGVHATNQNEWGISADGEPVISVRFSDNPVVAIDQSGVVVSNLEISAIDRIDADGIHQLNTIDVGERLATITDALTGVRAIANSATTLEELKSGIAAALTEV